MTLNLRSAIRDDVLSEFESPRPDFAFRVLGAIPDTRLAGGFAGPRRERHGRVWVQTLAVVMAAVIVALAMVAVRAARGDIALPAGVPFGLGGLHPPAANYFIPDAQFVSADNAWIVAQLHEHNGPTVVMATTDGGQTWHEQFRIPDGDGYGGLKFWNARDGELTEDVPSTLPPTKTPGAPGSSNMVPRIYRTSDGGAHWQLVDRPIDWSNLGGPDFSLTQLEAWRIPGRPLEQTPAVLQRTTDGGNSWTTVGTIPAGASLASQLTFSDSQTGWLTANESQRYAWDASGKKIPSTPPTALLWVTRNSGQTWSPVDIGWPAEATANDVRLEAPVFFGKDGILEFEVIGPPPTAAPIPLKAPTIQGWTHSYIVTTHDGGRLWSIPTRTPGGLQEGGAFFFDARHWLLSAGPKLSETLDGGKTWTTRQVLAEGLAFALAPWNYIDPRTIWSQVGPDRLVRSTDGGATWQSVIPPTINP
jgi:photosystem II stability/assembly factor-like uncharacterized protein